MSGVQFYYTTMSFVNCRLFIVFHGVSTHKGTTANTIIMQELQALFWLSAFYNFHITAVS